MPRVPKDVRGVLLHRLASLSSCCPKAPGLWRAVAPAALLAVGFATGCDDSSASGTPVEISEGERIYSSPLADGNTFTCSTCHALSEPTEDGFTRPGHPLGGATRRATYKNGQLTSMLEAVNSCQVEWMNAEPWGPDDADWIALRDFLDTVEGDGGAEVDFEIVQPPADLSGGDADAGRERFNTSCAVCHARDGIGSQLAPPVAMRGLEAELIGRRVRTSGRSQSSVYDGLTGGIMPFWAADRLTDTELQDIVAFIESTGDPVTGGGNDPGPGGGGTTRGCGVTHPLVGAQAFLQDFSHDVGGVATIVDDCTIEIRDFTFDGGGIDVRVYGGLGGDYDNGFAIGEDLTRPQPYDGETIVVQLDESMTLDDLDGVSIWCVPVGVDFGSAFFER